MPFKSEIHIADCRNNNRQYFQDKTTLGFFFSKTKVAGGSGQYRRGKSPPPALNESPASSCRYSLPASRVCSTRGRFTYLIQTVSNSAECLPWSLLSTLSELRRLSSPSSCRYSLPASRVCSTRGCFTSSSERESNSYLGPCYRHYPS